MAIKLNATGKKYVNALKTKMEKLGIYEDGDEDIILNDIGIHYQLYVKELEYSTKNDDKEVVAKADRYYKNVMNMVHKLGLTPVARQKLNVVKEPEEEEKSLFDKLEEM